MPKKKDHTHKIVVAILFVVIGIAIGLSITPKEVKDIQNILRLEGEKRIELSILAIDNFNNGVSSKLTTSIRPGDGLVLLNINNILADFNSQHSARTAAKVASEYTNISIENMDIIFSIDANATAIEGGSAGSAMAISTIAALQDRKLNPNVVISGSINEDGTFGTVGAIRQKANAALAIGKTIMLVPDGSLRFETNIKEQKSCVQIDGSEYCEVKFISEPAKELSNELGIEVIEVSNIEEALNFFYQEAN